MRPLASSGCRLGRAEVVTLLVLPAAPNTSAGHSGQLILARATYSERNPTTNTRGEASLKCTRRIFGTVIGLAAKTDELSGLSTHAANQEGAAACGGGPFVIQRRQVENPNPRRELARLDPARVHPFNHDQAYPEFLAPLRRSGLIAWTLKEWAEWVAA